MTHRGPFQTLLFCDSVISSGHHEASENSRGETTRSPAKERNCDSLLGATELLNSSAWFYGKARGASSWIFRKVPCSQKHLTTPSSGDKSPTSASKLFFTNERSDTAKTPPASSSSGSGGKIFTTGKERVKLLRNSQHQQAEENEQIGITPWLPAAGSESIEMLTPAADGCRRAKHPHAPKPRAQEHCSERHKTFRAAGSSGLGYKQAKSAGRPS